MTHVQYEGAEDEDGCRYVQIKQSSLEIKVSSTRVTALYFQLKEGCALRALIHKAPSTWHRVSLLFPCPLETGHKGKSILLHDVSVNSLHRIFTDDEVQRSPSCCRPSTSHEWVSAQVESLHHLASSLTCPPFPPSTGTGGRVFNRFGAKWVLEKAIYPGM